MEDDQGVEVEVVVEAGAVEAAGGVRVRGGRPFFLDLPLPCPAINNLYNMCISQ